MWREVSVDYSQKPTNSNEEIEGGLGDDVILVSRRTQNNTCVVRFGTMTRVGTESINDGLQFNTVIGRGTLRTYR